MPVLNFSYADVKDAAKFKQYVERAAALMAAHGVEVVARGQFLVAARGAEPGGQVAAVFRYADRGAVDAFYGCDAYAELIGLRDEACDMQIHLYQE